ncbi:DNA-processing protein DprA [Paenibacillus alvei]|nr:DNA-processing protein DprA [Paenibacillus alvei]MBG9733159.1 protein Smf [Paenibacillus alvei]MBG9745281.1 protein Smf [Paenibacillus alvei]
MKGKNAMSQWTISQIIIALHEAEGIGWHTIRDLMDRIGPNDLQYWMDRPSSQWQEFGMKPNIADRLAAQFRSEHLEQRLDIIERHGIEWRTAIDAQYPLLLRETAQYPWVIYGKGDWKCLEEASVSIVGTRTPTSYGKKVAATLGEQLSRMGLHVVSGLAKGIDAASHEGALKYGKTIAVMGTSFDQVYPPENRGLADRIADNGMVITEYPLGMKTHPGMFPRRNRIIAGLSLGTVVVEANLRSGALITADMALESNREIFAVPGPITSPKSAGTLKLLYEGSAKMIRSTSDIVEEFKGWLTTLPSSYNNETVDAKGEQSLTEEEKRIYELICEQDSTIDDLMQRSCTTFAQLHEVLLSLQLKKRIREGLGAVYSSE